MEYYVGLDVSLKQTSICVVNQTGSVVREGVVDSDPEAIASFVRSKAPGTVRIGIETGPTTTWLWTELNRLGLPVICIDARHAKAVLKMQINKSDRNDAAGHSPHHADWMVQGGARQGPRQPRGQGATGEPGVAGQDQA
jgi:transposase